LIFEILGKLCVLTVKIQLSIAGRVIAQYADGTTLKYASLPSWRDSMPDQFPDATKMFPTDADRLALALCESNFPDQVPCKHPCNMCRHDSANHCRELAKILRERHGGSSQVADWLDGVETHP